MFYAIHSKTQERINSLTVEDNPSYEFIKEDNWFADPEEIESCPNEINVNTILVNFRDGSTAISCNGKKYAISPHFYIPNKSKLGINTIPESKEHKLAKNWIYNRLLKPNQDKFLINYSKLNKGQHFHQFNLLDLPIDKNRINIEVTSSLLTKSRRADIICPFIVRHPILGNGIVFEIQFSKQKQKTRISRELDWAIRGYSISWLYEEDFEYLSETMIDTKKDSIDVDSFANLIKINKETHIKELKFAVQEEARKIQNKIQDMKEEFEEEMKGLQKAKLEKQNIDYNYISKFIEEKLQQIKRNMQPKCPRCGLLLKTVRRKLDNRVVWCCPDSCREGWMEVLD